MEKTFRVATSGEPLNSLRSRGSNMSKDEKATAILSTPFEIRDFMKGYYREVYVTGQVLSSLVKCMTAYPSLRLGQLLYCAITRNYQLDGVKDVTDEMLGCALFTIYDESLIEALDKFTEAKEKGKK
jgi:hypothetical protein